MNKFVGISKTHLRIVALAERVLPWVAIEPDKAFAISIARRFREGAMRKQSVFCYENDVGAALRYLEGCKLLTSMLVKEPSGRGGRVKLYALTSQGVEKISEQIVTTSEHSVPRKPVEA
jgi:hypothetical protein